MSDQMYYVVTSDKSFAQASEDLNTAVAEHGFGVLHIHNLGDTLRSKGVDFNEDCHVFEVCNPHQAAIVLAVDMKLNMALPCRISVYTENGRTKLGLIKPEQMLTSLTQNAALLEVAKEVEVKTISMVDAAR